MTDQAETSDTRKSVHLLSIVSFSRIIFFLFCSPVMSCFADAYSFVPICLCVVGLEVNKTVIISSRPKYMTDSYCMLNIQTITVDK